MSTLLFIFGPKILAYYNIHLCGGGSLDGNAEQDKSNLPERFSRRASCNTPIDFRDSGSQPISGLQNELYSGASETGIMVLGTPRSIQSLQDENQELAKQIENLRKSLALHELSEAKEEHPSFACSSSQEVSQGG